MFKSTVYFVNKSVRYISGIERDEQLKRHDSISLNQPTTGFIGNVSKFDINNLTEP